jgi:uncharacterized repeat protein (TIGR01451 family)
MTRYATLGAFIFRAVGVLLAASATAMAQPTITTAVGQREMTAAAIDPVSGAIYFAGDRPGTISRVSSALEGVLVAGTPGGSLADGVPAVQAAVFPGRNGLAVDAGGNIFFSEPALHRIRRIDAASGLVTTIAGTGSGGIDSNFFDGSYAISTPITAPGALAFDPVSGDLYAADEILDIVYRITGNGSPITRSNAFIYRAVGGDPANPSIYVGYLWYNPFGYAGDTGPAIDAKLNHPRGLGFDPLGNLFIADTGNNVIRRVDGGSGIITTVAGSGTPGIDGNNGPATAAQLFMPSGVYVEADGTIWIADTANHRIRVVSPYTGQMYTYLGDGVARFGSSSFAYPTGIIAAGVITIVDSQNRALAQFDPNADTSTWDIVARLATGGVDPGYVGDGAPGGDAVNQPAGVALDRNGNMFFSDAGNSRVRRVDASTHAVTTVAGNGLPGYDGDGGDALNARLNCPAGLAFGATGDLFIADTCANVVRRVAPGISGLITGAAGETMTTYAGTGVRYGTTDGAGGQATAARLNAPATLAIQNGSLLVGEPDVSQIRSIAPNGTIDSGVSGAEANAFTVDAAGNFILADGAESQDIACNGSEIVYTPDLGLGINHWGGAAVDTAGRLYLIESDAQQRVYRFGAPGGGSFCSATNGIDSLLVAGSGATGYTGDGGQATGATLNQPSGLAVDPAGNVWIADTGNNVVRFLQQPAVGVTASPTALDFGTQGLLTTSAGKIAAANATGTLSASFSATTLGGSNPDDFVIVADGCGSAVVTPGGNCQVTVAFRPTAPGARSALLEFNDNASGSPQTVTLTGSGVTLDVSPSPIAFGSQSLSMASAPTVVTITNDDASTVSILSLSFTGQNSGDFSTTNDSCTGTALGSHLSCTVGVVFTPQALGTRLATLSIASSAADSPRTIDVGGTGISLVPAAGIAPGAVAFPQTVVGNATAPVTITVTSTGTAPLTISSAALSGNQPSDFILSNDTCTGATLAPSQTCTLSVAFSPVEACSATGAAVTFTDNAANSPQSVALSGQAVGGATGPFQTTLFCTSHAAQPQELAAAPDGNVWFAERGSVFAPGAIGHANSSGGVISEDASAVLAGWHPSALSIASDGSYAYLESRGGGFNEWYDIVNPAGAKIQQPVVIPGPSGLGPDNGFWLTDRFTCADNPLFQHFAPNSDTVSVVPNQQWLFYNTNFKYCLAPSFVAPGPDGLEWIGSTNQGVDVGTNSPKGFVRVTVDNKLVDFTPTDAPPLAATIGPDGNMWALVANLGSQACSLEMLTPGAANAPIAMPPNVYVLGCFSIVSAPDHRLWMTALMFNGTAFVQALVAYRPGSGWTVYPAPSIVAPNIYLTAGPDEGIWFDAIPSDVGRFDLGGGPSRAYVTPQSIGFQYTSIGEPSTPQLVLVKSTGTQPLTIGSVTLAGPGASQFVIQNNQCLGAVLSPGDSCVVQVASRPLQPGTHFASLVITDNDGFSPQSVGLAAYDLPPGPTIVPTSTVFPTAIVGQHGTTVTFKLTNPFDHGLLIQSVSLDGNNAGDFKMISNSCANATVPANGGTCTVGVRFDPTAAGKRTATLTFSDAANPPTQVVNLTGKGQTTTGGTGTCDCDSTGLFVDPTIVYPQVVPVFGATSTSPHGSYTLEVQETGGKPSAFVITKNGAAAPLVTISAPNPDLTSWPSEVQHAWGFSPDDDRFVVHYASFAKTPSGTTDWIDTIVLYDLTSPTPGVPVHAPFTLPIAPEGSASGPEGSAAFSPSGAYLLTAQHQSTSTGQSMSLNIVTSSGQQVYQNVWSPASAPANPDDAAQSAFWGFAPDDKSFAYYLQEPGDDPILMLIALPAGSTAPIQQFHYFNAKATIVQFSPCGEVIAIVHQVQDLNQPNPVTISLYSTRPADAGKGAIAEKGALPIEDIQISAGPVNYTAEVDNFPDTVILAPNTNTGSCAPPTTSGDAGGSDAPAVAVPPAFKEQFDQSTAPPPRTATLGQLYSYTFEATGSPDPQFKFITNTCSFLTLDLNSGEVSGTPQTAFSSCAYSVTAFNGAGNADSPIFTITMTTAPPAGGAVELGGPYVPDDEEIEPPAASPSPVAAASTSSAPAVQLPAPTTLVLPHERGRIVVNADVTPSLSTFSYNETDGPSGPIGSLLYAGLDFTLTAVDAVTGAPVTTFVDSPVATIVYRVSDLKSARIGDPTALSLYWWNGSAWVDQMPCAGCGLDSGAGTLTVKLSQPGEYMLAASLPARTLTLTPGQITATVGAPFSGVLATFVPFSPDDLAGYYSATINWGDGQVSDGPISSTGSGTFAISGAHTWTASGTFAVTIAVQRGSPAGSTQTMALVSGTGQPPQFTAQAPPLAATVGASYSYTFAATGDPTPTYALAAGAPDWLSIGGTTGLVTGTPPDGAASFTYSVVASNGVLPDATAGPFVVAVSAPPAFTAAAPPLTATVGVAYSYAFAASGTPSPAFSLAGGAPAWLTIGGAGTVAGTPPTGTTSFTYSVIASNGVSPDATAGPYVVAVNEPPAFTAAAPPLTATVGVAYSYAFAASGTPSPTFSLDGGAPAWLSIGTTTGTVAGTPPTGTTSFTYSVIASNGLSPDATAGPFTVTVTDATNTSADVAVTIAAPFRASKGSTITYSIVATNRGPSAAKNIALVVLAGPGASYVSGDPAPLIASDGLWTWGLGSLAPGQSVTFTLRVKVNIAGTVLGAAAIAAETRDPKLANNVALVVTSVK